MSMSRRLVGLNAVLLALCGLFVIQIVRTLTAPAPTAPRRPGSGAAGAAPITTVTSADRSPKSEEATAAPRRPERAAYTSIATKNLFSPSRSETVGGVAAAPAGPPAPKPLLHGVVVSDTTSIAFLEDPTTKRITAHRVGDALAAGTVQSIAADSVVLTGPGGPVEVRLRDPSKPRPSRAPSATPGAAAPSRPDAPPAVGPAVPPTIPPTGPVVPRPLPPNLLRRTPPPPGIQPGGEQSQPGTAPPLLPSGMRPLPRPAAHG
jgi:hypothetical protein